MTMIPRAAKVPPTAAWFEKNLVSREVSFGYVCGMEVCLPGVLRIILR